MRVKMWRWLAACAVVVLAAAALLMRHAMSESEKSSAIEWAGLVGYVERGDIRWLSSYSAPDGQTYRFQAVVPAGRMSPAALGHAETDDHFLVRDRIARPGSTDQVHRTVSYFRESSELADRKVYLVVGVSNSLAALAG